MLALGDLEADTCPGCKGWLSETTESDGPDPAHVYTVRKHVCHRCAAQAHAAKADEKHPDRQALLYSVTSARRAP